MRRITAALRRRHELAAAVITLNQHEHFLDMIAEPPKTLDTRPNSMQEHAKP